MWGRKATVARQVSQALLGDGPTELIPSQALLEEGDETWAICGRAQIQKAASSLDPLLVCTCSCKRANLVHVIMITLFEHSVVRNVLVGSMEAEMS